MGISGYCSQSLGLQAGQRWRVARRLRRAIRRLSSRITRQSARLDGRNAAPRTPARAATPYKAAAAATTYNTLRDAIDATARMQQHNKPRAPTTNRTNARILVRARASASGRRRRAQTKEPAHALVRIRSRHLHAGIVLRVRTALQGFLSSYWVRGHDATRRERNCRVTETRRNVTSYQGDL